MSRTHRRQQLIALAGNFFPQSTHLVLRVSDASRYRERAAFRVFLLCSLVCVCGYSYLLCCRIACGRLRGFQGERSLPTVTMPWNKRWLVPPLGLLGSFVVWRSLKRTPLSKVASSAEIGRLRSESHQNLAKMDDAKRSPSPGMTKNKASPSPLQQNHLSYMSTRSLVRLMWQTFNSGHFRGGLRRGVFIALLCAWGTRWLMRFVANDRCDPCVVVNSVVG